MLMSLSSTSVSKLHLTIIHLYTVEDLPALPFSVSFSVGISTPMDIYRKFHYVKNTNKNNNDLIRNFMDLNFSIDYKFTHDSFNYEFISIYTHLYTYTRIWNCLLFWKFIQNLLANLFAICNSIILLATEF